ncbi:ABC transporter permease DevC [Cyanothece sp. BG0011]|uniref:ABC transporter permease DevC n=1 Tax=Cyanothece sp. BG0011 TaxID=2082950 RepID=UPI000D1EB502|nr:ABC transporter permease DevC [Cyanothece sp. BG0011]
MSLKTPLAWLQLVHEKPRFLAALAGIAFADLLMFMQLGFQLSIYYSQSEIHRRLKGDIVLISAKTVSLQSMKSFSWRRLYQANSLEQVASVKPLYLATLPDWKDPETGRSRIMLTIGFDPEQPVLDVPEVNQYLQALKAPDVFLFDRVSRGDFVEKVAAKIEREKSVTTEAGGRRINLIGLFTLGAMPVADGNLITSDLNFVRLFRGRKLSEIDVGVISLKPNSDVQQVISQLKTILPKDVRVLSKEEYIEFEKSYIVNSTDIGQIFNIGIIMGAIIGSVIVYQVFYSQISENLPEYATLKAIGYQDSVLLGVIFRQALYLTVLGYIPGYILALVFYDLTSNIIKVTIFMTLPSAILVFGLSFVICSVSAFISARKLRLADPADIFS